MYAILLVATLCMAPSVNAQYSGVVWIYGDNCPACASMHKMVNNLIVEGAPIVVIKINGEADWQRYGIQGIPSTFAYHKGVVVLKVSHAIDEKAFRLMLQTAGSP